MANELVNRLQDPDAQVRRDTVLKLSELRDDAATDALIRTLRDPEKSVQDEAVQALKKAGGPRAVEGLLSLLKDEDALLRNNARHILEKIGSTALDPVLLGAGDPDRDVRIFTANILGKIKHPRAEETLIRLLQDKEANVRDAAIISLGELRSEPAVPHLERMLMEEKEVWGIFSVTDALVRVGTPPALHALLKGFESQRDDMILSVIIDAIGKMKNPECVRPMVNRLNKGGRDAQFVLIAMLVRHFKDELMKDRTLLKDVGFIDKLVQFVSEDRDVWSRYYMVEFLGRAAVKEHVPVVIGLLSHKESLLRVAAAKALGEMGSPEAMPALEEAMNKQADPLFKQIAEVAVNKLRG